RYVANPLVFCGCVGLIPKSKINKEAHNGDAIVVIGGRTGRDGIHGATFSSAELTDTHADEFSHAVQIGNAITQKKMADVILQATRKAVISRGTSASPMSSIPKAKSKIKNPADLKERLLSALSHPNIASKHWIIRQYDHEVQGGSIIKPLTGPLQQGPSDAAVIRPKLNSHKGIAIACGLAPHIADPYQMAIASIDEAIRNAVCV